MGQTDEGESVAMTYAVAEITTPLDSVSQICDAGNKVVFTREGGWIEGPDEKKTCFERDGDTYRRITWVKNSRCEDPEELPPFVRQRPNLS